MITLSDAAGREKGNNAKKRINPMKQTVLAMARLLPMSAPSYHPPFSGTVARGRPTLRFPKRRAILSPLRRSARMLATLNSSPAENVPFREVNSSQGTTFIPCGQIESAGRFASRSLLPCL